MTLTTVNPALLDTQAQYTGFKNRIINGAMVIDQRNAGALIAGSDNAFAVDRFPIYHQSGSGSKGNIEQNLNNITPAVGFRNYLGFTTTSAYAVGASDGYAFNQRIEGNNVADFMWGTSNAATITLSFWVNCSLTGTFGGAVRNNSATRSYPFTYIISAANTWEYKTITIVGDTSGTWETGNLLGIMVFLGLGVGSTYSGPAGSWSGAGYVSATGAVSVVGTSGATFYITGVQLEKGSTATSFDYRPYGTELGLCQRYYEFGQNSSGGAYVGAAGVSLYSMTCYKATKRVAPTITTTNCQTQASAGAVTNRTFGTSANDTQGFGPLLAGSDPVCYVTWQASAEL